MLKIGSRTTVTEVPSPLVAVPSLIHSELSRLSRSSLLLAGQKAIIASLQDHETLKALCHPNLVQVLDHIVDGPSRPILVMEPRRGKFVCVHHFVWL